MARPSQSPFFIILRPVARPFFRLPEIIHYQADIRIKSTSSPPHLQLPAPALYFLMPSLVFIDRYSPKNSVFSVMFRAFVSDIRSVFPSVPWSCLATSKAYSGHAFRISALFLHWIPAGNSPIPGRVPGMQHLFPLRFGCPAAFLSYHPFRSERPFIG